jgi:hypothetical protein
MRHGELPRNSTTFFGAATGNSPFGKDFGLRKECACNFGMTNYLELLVTVLGTTVDFSSFYLVEKVFFSGNRN